MAEEEEVAAEVEAVAAVYGDDCHVIRRFPPRLAVLLRPRTADDTSQQFVEAVIGIEAGPEYPMQPPSIKVIESKGLDERRKKQLIDSIKSMALGLSSSLMLVALYEEAVEILSNMNHPEGNCPLCLYPLFAEDEETVELPFMKLMSCFHCFHSVCVLRWWKWLQDQEADNRKNDTVSAASFSRGLNDCTTQQIGRCPVCRMMFDTKDIEHVIDLLNADSPTLSPLEMDIEGEEVLNSDQENSRRQKFENILKTQKEICGLIEPRKTIAIVPGIFLPEAATRPTTSTSDAVDRCKDDAAPVTSACVSDGPSNNSTTGQNSRINKRFFRHPRKERNKGPARWVQKENGSH